ncbi:Platelet-activating factor acetylhydrolase, isoform II [Micromonospora mirobrigensis]|uniref:Platelet-activating factor acetylhydrolase, isoform II n=1 Tax=Micromonospora mirobrigensis TaxID=262898 RepID=A0A1C4XT14_9ACTN|nr:Platelet-activating factor acetylhydrolase, isoform II [Micromonospora mirobrigensis]
MTALLAGCGPATAATTGTTAATGARGTTGTTGSGGVAPAQSAPRSTYPVGVRQLTVDPAGSRPLPLTVWYPTAGGRPAAGRFPVIVYSHGLRSLPELHAPLTTRWAAAGFVVAAPTYPRTNLRASHFTRADVRNQPADGWRVIRYLVRLDAGRDDPLAGHLDVSTFDDRLSG